MIECGACFAVAMEYNCCIEPSCKATSALMCKTTCAHCYSGGGFVPSVPGLDGPCASKCPLVDAEWTETSSLGSVVQMYERTACRTERIDGVCQAVFETEYSCAAGGYPQLLSHNPDTGTYTYRCVSCPDSGVSAEYNENISGCYVPMNSARTDDVGEYEYQNYDCYYSDSAIVL